MDESTELDRGVLLAFAEKLWCNTIRGRTASDTAGGVTLAQQLSYTWLEVLSSIANATARAYPLPAVSREQAAQKRSRGRNAVEEEGSGFDWDGEAGLEGDGGAGIEGEQAGDIDPPPLDSLYGVRPS